MNRAWPRLETDDLDFWAVVFVRLIREIFCLVEHSHLHIFQDARLSKIQDYSRLKCLCSFRRRVLVILLPLKPVLFSNILRFSNSLICISTAETQLLSHPYLPWIHINCAQFFIFILIFSPTSLHQRIPPPPPRMPDIAVSPRSLWFT